MNSAEKSTGSSLKILLPCLALVAAGIAAYLLFLALANKGLPAGCGDNSGCAEVLTSRWSVIAGIPVRAPAVLVYLSVFVMSLLPSRPLSRSLLTITSFVLLYSAVWFVGLQLFYLEAICPWW